jgi:polysaccharide biosynthesis/export protein
MKLNINILFLIIFLSVFVSCVSTKKYTYFNDIEKASKEETVSNEHAILIEPGDILQITITTLDKDISMLFNPNAMNSGSGSINNPIPQGYLVDAGGNVEVPMIGKVSVKGKTTSEINEIIKAELNKTIKNAFVATRLINFKISVLGDVAKPGSFNIPNEKVSILEALSLAGDLNITAVRDDLMLIREVEGKRKYISIDLNDSKSVSSQYYYLNNNDVLYVKPGESKVFNNSRGFQLLPTVLGALSLITVILTNVIK